MYTRSVRPCVLQCAGSPAPRPSTVLSPWPASSRLALLLDCAPLPPSSTFSPEQPIEALHTQQARQVYLCPEPDFWMSFAVNVASRDIKQGGKTGVEYLDQDVHSSALKTHLQQAYALYKVCAAQ